MLTLRDISSRIGGTLEGNTELLVAGPSEPKYASEEQLAMALSNQYINEILEGANGGKKKLRTTYENIIEDLKNLNLKF